jgi:hypothetical protein
MYEILLIAHSLNRWAIVITVLLSVIFAIIGIINKTEFGKKEHVIRLVALICSHLQLIFGLILYFVSPIVASFLAAPKDMMKVKEIRYWGVEHTAMMIISIMVLTIGYSLSKRAESDLQKYRYVLIYFAIAFLIMLIGIPFPFSYSVQRPWINL